MASLRRGPQTRFQTGQRWPKAWLEAVRVAEQRQRRCSFNTGGPSDSIAGGCLLERTELKHRRFRVPPTRDASRKPRGRIHPTPTGGSHLKFQNADLGGRPIAVLATEL